MLLQRAAQWERPGQRLPAAWFSPGQDMYLGPARRGMFCSHSPSNRSSGRSVMKRNIFTGGAILSLAAILGIWSVQLEKRATVNADTVMAPKFEVDPFWPKPL